MIIIEKFSNPNDKIEIIAELNPIDEKFGYNEMRTLYAELIIEESGSIINKVQLNIEDSTPYDKEFLRNAWKNKTKLNIIDDNNDIYNGVIIIGNQFGLSRKFLDDGTEIWTGTLNLET